MESIDIAKFIAGFAHIEKYCKCELSEEDFWYFPDQIYYEQSEKEKYYKCYTVNPAKLNKATLLSREMIAFSEKEKQILLNAFKVIRNYSNVLPKNALLKERLLVAKKFLPRFISPPNNLRKNQVIPWRPKPAVLERLYD